MANKTRGFAKDPIVEEYLQQELRLSHAQYVDNAVWAAIREALENKQGSALRKQIQEAAEPKLIADAYAWKFIQGTMPLNTSNKHN